MDIQLRPSRRNGVAGLVIAAILFAIIFTTGFSYLLFQSQADQASYNAAIQAQSARQLANQEQLLFGASVAGTTLTVTVNDTGALPLSVVSWYIKDATGKLTSPGVVNLANPLNLDVGYSGQITLMGYNYPAGALVYISLLTSRGNVFTVQYPLSITLTTTTATSVISTTVTGPGSGGGNSLVVVMAATPVQTFSGGTIVDNVTVYNYANVAVTGVAIVGAAPTVTVTGTAIATFAGCAGPYTPPGQISDPSGTISAYSGSGLAPHIYFLCSYGASSGAVGGLASFNGQASAVQGTNTVYSASETSNLVQIGGVTNALAQGAFTSNFFFFKYSSCTNAPSGGRYSPSCTTNAAMPPASVYNLPQGSVMSGGSNYYVAYYIQITNNFNTTLPLLQYTFEQFDQSSGGESDWWLVGTTATLNNGVYYPSYSGSLPTLTAYPTDCNVVNGNNVPTDAKCLYVNPGQTVTITLASCGPGSASWDWGGSSRGSRFDSGSSGCVSSTPSIGSGGSATAGITVISFWYKGATLTEDLAFQGVAFTS